MAGKRKTVEKLLDCLGYLQETGVRTVEVDVRALAAEAARKAGAAKGGAEAVRGAAAPGPGRRADGFRPVAEKPAPQVSEFCPSGDVVPDRAPEGTVDTLESLAAMIRECQRCVLAPTRTNTVPGQGRLQPDVMFVGEGPGADEDAQGLAFVGRAGQLLTKMIEAMGYKREEVFIGNIVKCRPPGNRTPLPQEMACCMPFLKRQIAVIRPKVLVCMGMTAVTGLTGELPPLGRIRGTWREFEGIPVMLTYHPAYLLRDPRKKVEAWKDLQQVMERLGRGTGK